MKKHFYNGFIKRAQDYGLSVVEAIKLAETVNITPDQRALGAPVQTAADSGFDPTNLVAPALIGTSFLKGTPGKIGRFGMRGLATAGATMDAADSFDLARQGDYSSAAARAAGTGLYFIPKVGPIVGSAASPFINKYIDKEHGEFLNSNVSNPEYDEAKAVLRRAGFSGNRDDMNPQEILEKHFGVGKVPRPSMTVGERQQQSTFPNGRPASDPISRELAGLDARGFKLKPNLPQNTTTGSRPSSFFTAGNLPQNSPNQTNSPIPPKQFPNVGTVGNGIGNGIGGFAGNKPRPTSIQPTPATNSPRLDNSGGSKPDRPIVGN